MNTNMETAMTEDMPANMPGYFDGANIDRDGHSPSSSAGAPPRPRPKQVPIARNMDSGYQRPERARTSHACEPCRERKTKCDGERPSCRRCLHTGTGCHYGYGKGWKKRKTAEDLTVTSRKLARYEELLNDIFPLVSNNVKTMIDEARQQQFGPLDISELDDLSVSASSNSFDTGLRNTSPPTGRLPPLSVTLTHSAPPFITTPRGVPDSSHSQQSPLRATSSAPTVSRSPPDDIGGGPPLRLPSITRHGILVEEGLLNQLSQGSVPAGQDARMVLDPQSIPLVDGEPSRIGISGASSRRLVDQSF